MPWIVEAIFFKLCFKKKIDNALKALKGYTFNVKSHLNVNIDILVIPCDALKTK